MTQPNIPLLVHVEKLEGPDRGISLSVQVGSGEAAPMHFRVCLTPENAEKVAQAMLQKAAEAKTGLTLPSGSLMKPAGA